MPSLLGVGLALVALAAPAANAQTTVLPQLTQLDQLLQSGAPGSIEEQEAQLTRLLNELHALRSGRDRKTIDDHMAQLRLWRHSEHFLERIPAAFLEKLRRLRWPISDKLLLQALDKLESLLPTHAEDGITCDAGTPMLALLDLLIQQNSPKAAPRLRRYIPSLDHALSDGAALRALRLDGQAPLTGRELLTKEWDIRQRSDLDKLSDLQRRIALIVTADEGARNGGFAPWFDARCLADALVALQQEHLYAAYDFLESYLTIQESSTTPGLSLIEVDLMRERAAAYALLPGPSPTALMTLKLLDQPQLRTLAAPLP